MDVYTTFDLPAVRRTVVARLRRGDIGILPTDTIYGLCGDALSSDVVARVLAIKRRRRPMTVVPPDLAWARSVVAPPPRVVFEATMESYRGPFTLLWRVRGGAVGLPRALIASGLIGMRRPHHWISEVAASVGRPILSTSANVTKRPYMTSLDDLDDEVSSRIDFIVYQGPLLGPPSTIVHTTQKFMNKERA